MALLAGGAVHIKSLGLQQPTCSDIGAGNDDFEGSTIYIIVTFYYLTIITINQVISFEKLSAHKYF